MFQKVGLTGTGTAKFRFNTSSKYFMQFTLKRNTQIVAYLLLVLVATQALFTVLYSAGIVGPGAILWGLEAVLFSVLAAFAGAALVQAGTNHIGWSAIAFSAVLNVIQVSIGLKLFGPFGEVAQQSEATAPLMGAVVAMSFMIYNAAKVLLGLAAVVFGLARMSAGGKILGGLTAAVGGLAVLTNAVINIVGRESFLPSPVAGATGVIATVLLAICLMSVKQDD